MRITSLKLKDIGVFEDIDISFEKCPTPNKAEIHIFTGTNGSGKSTLLKSLVSAFEHVGRTSKNEFILDDRPLRCEILD